MYTVDAPPGVGGLFTCERGLDRHQSGVERPRFDPLEHNLHPPSRDVRPLDTPAPTALVTPFLLSHSRRCPASEPSSSFVSVRRCISWWWPPLAGTFVFQQLVTATACWCTARHCMLSATGDTAVIPTTTSPGLALRQLMASKADGRAPPRGCQRAGIK